MFFHINNHIIIASFIQFKSVGKSTYILPPILRASTIWHI